ncbi:MAG: hypothetical protein QOK05_20 [Chloroflexota bacterium]|nr:hypothetical protein [Chloroflexota bacterium]
MKTRRLKPALRGGLLLSAVLVGALASQPAMAAVPAWPTYHLNNNRDGNNTAEGPFSPGSTPAWQKGLDGAIYAEPLVLGNQVLVATEEDTVYSLDIHTGAVNWSQQVRTPSGSSVPLFPVSQQAQSGCGNIFPLGVTGTPVIDPANNQLYVVAAAWDGVHNTSIHHYFWALDLGAGGNPVVAGVVVDGPANQGFDPHNEQQRSALALRDGHVYVTYGGLAGDCFAYNGWIVRIDENGTGILSLNVTLAAGLGQRGGIWAPSGPAIDAAGNIYVATGNGNTLDNSQPSDLSDSVVKLSPTLAVLDHFTPTNWGDENRADLDLGANSPLLLSGGLLYQGGKTGAYLLNTASLGGGNDKGGQLFFSSICAGFAGNAYDAATDVIYAACNDGVRALQVHRANTGSCSTTTTPCFTVKWRGPGDASAPPILAGGKLWVRGRTFGYNSNNPPTTKLYGLDPASGDATVELNGIDASAHFGTPTLISGTLIIGSGSTLFAYTRPPLNWYPLGGTFVGRTAVGTNGDGRLEGFARAAGGAIAHGWQTAPSGGWTAWYPLGGALAGDPTVATNRDGRLEVFAVGNDGRLWHAWQVAPSSSWTAWYPLGGSFTGRPAVEVNRDGRLEVFLHGTDNAVWHIWQDAPGQGWTAPVSLGGTTANDPAVGLNNDGRIEAVARRSDNTTWHTWQVSPGGGWTDWYSLGGSTTGAPAVLGNTDGRLEVFGLGVDHTVAHTWQTAPSGGWGGFQSLGGNFTVDPTTTRNRDGRLEAFAVDAAGLAWHNPQASPGGGWSGWASLPVFASAAQPSVGMNADGRLELLDRSSDGSTWHDWQKTPGHNW